MAQDNNHNLSSGNNISGNESYNGLHNNGVHSPAAEEDTIDLTHLFYRLWNYKWVIAGITLFCVLLAGIIAAATTSIYRSEGTIMISSPDNRYSYAGSDLANLLTTTYGIGQGSTLANELLILKSKSLSREIADTLMEDPLMRNGQIFPVLFMEYPDDSTMASKDAVASRLRQNLMYTQISREADLINVVYESPSPLEAAYIVNITMELYGNLSMRQNRKAATSAVEFLENERARIKEELGRSEELLLAFMNTENLVQVDNQTSALINRIAELEAEKQQARVGLVAANSAIAQFEERLNSIEPGLAAQFTKAIGPEMERLQYQLAELKIQKSSLLYNYPNIEERETPPGQIVDINNQIVFYQNEIQDLTQQLITSREQYAGFMAGNIGENISDLNQKLIMLRVEQQQFQAQIETIDEQLAREEQFFQDLPDNMIDLARLKRNMEINEQLFLGVSQQYAEMSLWQQTQFGLGRVIDPAFVSEVPVIPDTSIYLLLGFVLGTIIGLGYVFTKEAFNTSVDSVEKLKSLGVPLLALIPDMSPYIKKEQDGNDKVTTKDAELSAHLITVHDTISPISESFRRLEGNIVHTNPDIDLKTLMVTSATKGEGKTTVIANLGVIMAEGEQKVIIVETDLRRPNVHNLFGIKSTPGMMNMIFENESPEHAIRQTLIPNLDLLPAGYVPPNPRAVTKSKAFLNIINDLKGKYDFVLLDTSPYGIITDALSMIKESDGIIVAAKFNQTSQVQLKHTLEGLSRINANVVGTVMTHFDYTKSQDYSYGGGYYKKVYEDYRAYEA